MSINKLYHAVGECFLTKYTLMSEQASNYICFTLIWTVSSTEKVTTSKPMIRTKM